MYIYLVIGLLTTLLPPYLCYLWLIPTSVVDWGECIFLLLFWLWWLLIWLEHYYFLEFFGMNFKINEQLSMDNCSKINPSLWGILQIFIFFIPGNLSFGIISVVLCDQIFSFFKRNFSLQIRNYFLVTNGFESWAICCVFLF